VKKSVLCLAATLLIASSASSIAATRPAAANVDENDARLIKVVTGPGQPTNQHLTLGLNKATIVELDSDAKDVMVSSPDIVDAVVKTPRRIFLLGTKVGQTNAFFFDAAGHQMMSLDIRVEKDVADLASLMKANLPNSAIKVSALNDNVVITGSVSSALESTRAADLAASFTGDPKKVVNLLRVASSEQVMLRVRISEMQRQIAKQFGINLSGVGIVGGSTPFALATDNQFGLLGRALDDLSGGQIGQLCANPAALQAGGCNNAQGTFKALETVGLLHTLAEPNLTAVSGETAKFLAGGEFPVPSGRDQQGNVAISFKQFGVGLSFTPVVLSSGRISLQLSTEVSELTNTGAFTLAGGSTTVNGSTVTTAGLTIPALDVRRAETTIELPSGGTFAIAGLMQHTTKQQIDAFPGIKDLPVLGALFRSRDFQNNETELVVMVTAYLVSPTAETALATPGDGFITPTDPETILLGRLNTVYKKSAAPLTPEAAAPVGFVVR
jgi:pilus assembly protein CpaC